MSEKECCFSGVVGTKNAKNSVFWLYENAKLTNGGWLAANVKEALKNLSRHQGLEILEIQLITKLTGSAYLRVKNSSEPDTDILVISINYPIVLFLCD